MKSCPKCKSVYYDETLEFCMEDGSNLIETSVDRDEIPTVITNKINNVLIEKTLEFSHPDSQLKDSQTAQNEQLNTNKKIEEKLTVLKEKVSYQGLRIIEILPVILALANNYWQWLYLHKTMFENTLSFLISINFLVWSSFFVLGLLSCFIALKFGKNKGFAIIALVILAINLLLNIVPLK